MAKRAMGTTISINGVLIGGLTSIKPPERSADTIETTTLDSAGGYKEFIQGFKDGGEVALTGFYDQAYTGLVQVDAAFENGTSDTYIINFPANIGATFTFVGLITKLASPGEATTDKTLGFDVTIKVIGKPVLATTPSAGLSALVLSGTTGVLSPAFNNVKYAYAWTFTTDTSITVTPTGASHTIKLYVDNVYIQDITSGGASAAITGFTAAATSRQIDIICYESGKTPKTYSVVAIRTT